MQIESKQIRRSIVFGERKTREGRRVTAKFPEPSKMAHLFDSHVKDVVTLGLLLIMKTMTSRLMLCGYASLVTSRDTKR